MKKSLLILIIFILAFTGCSKNDDPLPGQEGNIIVLMYHRITEGTASNLYERSVADFESDLKYLINNNIKVISFSDLEGIKESGKMPVGHSAIISFDDGDRSWYTLAMPLLRKLGMNATFFLWVNMIEKNSFVTWNEVEYMSNITFPGGEKQFVFGSHSYSHPFLLDRKAGFSSIDEYNSFLDYELGRSKSLIETYTPGEVTILALPYGNGAGDTDIIAAAKRNGYKYIRTSVHGAIRDHDADLYIIPSVPMLDSTEPSEIGYYLNQ